MSKACGITGPLHSKVRNDTHTASGAKSELQDLFPPDETEVFFEVNRGTKAKPNIEKVQRNIIECIDSFIVADNNAKAAKEQAEEAAMGIRIAVNQHRVDQYKDTDKYQKAYRVNGSVKGKRQFAVSAAAQDRFSVPKKEKDIDAIRGIVGKKFFNEHFEKDLTIAIRKEVMASRKQRQELTKKLIEVFGGEDELKKWFTKSEVWAVKSGLNEAILKLDEETRDEFLEKCPQSADQIKNCCYDPKEA